MPDACSQAPPRVARLCASSRFLARNHIEKDVRLAFRSRAHLVDSAPGFCRTEVMQPLESPHEFWLMTWWTDDAAFITWHKGHDHRRAYAGIPKGLKLVAGSVQIGHLGSICS